MAREVIKSDCIMCINSCGKRHGRRCKVVKVEGMKEHPISECSLPKRRSAGEWVYSPTASHP